MTTVTERRIVREADHVPPQNRTRPRSPPPSGILKGGKLWKTGDSMSETEDIPDDGDSKRQVRFENSQQESTPGEGTCDEATQSDDIPDGKDVEGTGSPDCTELTLTFKLGHVLVANSVQRPNSAVRQLFPASAAPEAEKASPATQDESAQFVVTAESLRLFEEAKRAKLAQFCADSGRSAIRRTIERNTLRRSLLQRKGAAGGKIRAHTDGDQDSLEERIRRLTCDLDEDEQQSDTCEPVPAPEELRASPQGEEARKPLPPAVASNPPVPATSATSPSSASVTSSSSNSSSTYKKLTDLFARRNNPEWQQQQQPGAVPLDLGNGKCAVTRADARKQFLSTLAPLAACVTSGTAQDDQEDGNYYQQQQQQVVMTSPVPGDRASVASSAAGTEYSLDDIDEALGAPQPDVVAGAPVDELALFVEQDAGRIERIKQRYNDTNNNNNNNDKDDEHDDYGFNRRPSVRGIKPRFGSTTEILQQMQSQLQPPALLARSHVSWPDRRYLPQPQQQQIMRIGGGCSNSPPPDQYHHYATYGRRMTPPPPGVVQMRISPTSPVGLHHHQPPLTAIIEPHYSSPITTTSVIRVGHGQQQTIRVPYPTGTPVQVHLLTDSPQRASPRPQYVVARGTQTGYPVPRYYPNGAYMQPPQVRPYPYMGFPEQPQPPPGYKMVTSPVPPVAPAVQLGSPTRSSTAAGATGERGVPEGAASCSPSFPQDAVPPPDNGAATSTATSVYYAMNV
ncbi:hypothetical protein C0J52_07497 [Blattella germanica]|nr:hypothetical protein C0J52_07497 [Blattella germanica]